MFSKKIKDRRYNLERSRKKSLSYRKNSHIADRGRLDEQDSIPEDRFNVRRNRIKHLTETYSANSNIFIGSDLEESDYSADQSDQSEMSSKESKGTKKKKSKKVKKSKQGPEQAQSPELSSQQSKTGGEESPKPVVPMEPVYEINKRSSGSVKNLPENQRNSESLVSVSRTAVRSKQSVHRSSGVFSPSNLLHNSVKSNHPSKQFSPVLKTQEEGFNVPEDFENIARKASNSGYQAGSIHSFQNVSIIPASRTASNYFKNDISTQTEEPVNLAPGSPNYTNTSRKPSKLAIVPGSCESVNQRGTGPRPPYLDNDYVPENRNHIGCIPAQNRDLQTRKCSTSKNKFICYRINEPSADKTFTEDPVHKQVPQKNVMLDHGSKTYVSHAPPPPQWDAQPYYDDVERQYESSNICADDISSPEARDFIYEKKQFRKTSVSNSETNAAKMQLCEHRQQNKVGICEGPRKSAVPTRTDGSDRNKVPVSRDGGAQFDRKSSVYEVGASKSCDCVKSLKDWNTMVARDFEHLLALYQNFKTLSTKWACIDEGHQVELVGKERSNREDDRLDTNEAFYMDILDDADNKLDGRKDKLTIMIASDDECLTTVTTEDGQKPVNSEDGQKSECSKLSKGIHNSVEYLKLYRICCAAKAASEADIKIPGIDNNGYVEEGFVDYLQQNRDFDVRKLINICGIQLVSVDEDIVSNLHNYIQMYRDYQAQKNGCTGAYKDAEHYSYTENTFKSYVQSYFVFSAAKLLSEEGQKIPGVDKNGFLDEDFLNYLQQSREFSVRKVINDCSFSAPTAYIVNNISRYIQEYCRLYDEYQAKNCQIPEPITQRQPVCGHQGQVTQKQTVYGQQDSTTQRQPVCCHLENTTQRQPVYYNQENTTQRQPVYCNQDNTTQRQTVYASQDPKYAYPVKEPEVIARGKRGLKIMQNCALLRNACENSAHKNVCCSACQVEDMDLLIPNESKGKSQRNGQEEKKPQEQHCKRCSSPDTDKVRYVDDIGFVRERPSSSRGHKEMLDSKQRGKKSCDYEYETDDDDYSTREDRGYQKYYYQNRASSSKTCPGRQCQFPPWSEKSANASSTVPQRRTPTFDRYNGTESKSVLTESFPVKGSNAKECGTPRKRPPTAATNQRASISTDEEFSDLAGAPGRCPQGCMNQNTAIYNLNNLPRWSPNKESCVPRSNVDTEGQNMYERIGAYSKERWDDASQSALYNNGGETKVKRRLPRGFFMYGVDESEE